MSKSVAITFRGQGFWAFDVTTKVLLKHLVDVAEKHEAAYPPWLGEALATWRINMLLADCFGFGLDASWSDVQIDVVVSLLQETCALLEKRQRIPASEIEGWTLLNGDHIFARGLEEVRAKPLISLAGAVILLLKRSLPSPPVGTYWWYGVDDFPEIVKSRA